MTIQNNVNIQNENNHLFNHLLMGSIRSYQIVEINLTFLSNDEKKLQLLAKYGKHMLRVILKLKIRTIHLI